MMAYLTRPGFNGGGSVSNRNVLPKRKPAEEVKKRKKINYEKLKQYLGEESREFIERELGFAIGGRTNYEYGGITLNKKGPYKGFYAITLSRRGKNVTLRDKDKSVLEQKVKEFEATRPPTGGAAVKTKRKVEGISEKNLTRLREIITNKARERNLPAPNFEKYPGRGYPSNTPGNVMAKDLIRGIKKTGTRGGKDFKTVGAGSGSKALTNPLSKPEKELLEKTFTDVNFDFTKSRFGIDRKVNPELYRQAVNLVKENPKLVFGFQFMKPENYLLTTFQRARVQQLADTGVSEYVPIYKNQKIIGFQDNTQAGGGKKFYHDNYKGGTSIKAHPNFKKVAKYVDIVKDTRGDHIPVLNKLFTDAGEKVPTFDQLLNDLLDSPGRGGAGSISAAIEKHHTKGVKTSTADLQLLTRDKNKLAALIEGRVDAGKMDLETADRILKPEGIQIERGGVKIGAPDIDPKKQIADYKKFVTRKTLEKAAIAKSLRSAGFKCKFAGKDGGDVRCDDPMSYIDDMKRNQNMATQGSPEAKARAFTKFRAAKSFLTGTLGPAALAGEALFSVPFALYDFSTGANRDEIISNLTLGIGGKSQEEQLTELYGENFGLAQKAIETGERLENLEEEMKKGGSYRTRADRIFQQEKLEKQFDEQLSPFIKDGQFDEAAFQENRKQEQLGIKKFGEQKAERAKQRKDTLTGLEFDLGFAGGGIAKEGGVDSGVAPESGPTPDGPSGGLASLLKNGMKEEE